MPAPPVTIAVVSWNTRELLDRCLASLRPEAERGRADVWVVDNASTDGSPDLVRERHDWAHLIASEDNLGFGAAVNVVARQTTSEWVVPANADIALRPGALDALLDAGARDGGAGAIAPRLILMDGSTQHSAFAFPTIPYTLLLSAGAFRFMPSVGDRYAVPSFWDSSRARRVPWAVAAFLLVRRTAWDEVGGFDDRQWMYAEDLDLAWRLRQAGWATRYEPRAYVDHAHGAATAQHFGPEVAPHYQRSTYGFLARRRGVAHAWTIALLMALGAVPRWLRTVVRGEDKEVRDAYRRWVLVHLKALRGRGALESLK
jgi:N-acetylglucosaminyl-diphospho-decaprenol L-rhamnosyltransferase